MLIAGDGAIVKQCCLAHWCYVAAAVTIAATTFRGLYKYVCSRLRLFAELAHMFSVFSLSPASARKLQIKISSKSCLVWTCEKSMSCVQWLVLRCSVMVGHRT